MGERREAEAAKEIEGTAESQYVAFDQIFEHYRYPAGESHLALKSGLALAHQIVIEAQVRCFDDLGQLLTADQILRRNGVQPTWFVPYFPFARHDRRNYPGDGFELGIALEMVRNLDIAIADPHSDVAGQLRHFPQSCSVKLFERAGAFDNDPIVVIPDVGATKKAKEWAEGSTVQALKHRNPANGRLSGFEVLADDLGGKPCLIIDDICDGGGTFLGLAKALKEKNAGQLTLAVTHGLFTKGTLEITGAFDRIFAFAYATSSSSKGSDSKEHCSNGIEYVAFQDLYTEGVQR